MSESGYFDVTGFEGLWCVAGPAGGGPSPTVHLQESRDKVHWKDLGPAAAPLGGVLDLAIPGRAEHHYRVKVSLAGVGGGPLNLRIWGTRRPPPKDLT